MPALPDHQLSPQELPSSLGYRFWRLATHTGAFTEQREPVAVVRHAVAAIRSLQGDELAGVGADSLAFVMGLDGNPRYASPEQRRGASESSQSLVYSLAVLLFERLTGYHPFADTDSSERGRGSRGRDLCHIPADLRGILHRALAPFPEDRYPDADALRYALEGYLRNEAHRRRRSQTGPQSAPGSTARKMQDALRAPTEVDEHPPEAAATNDDAQLEAWRGPTEVDHEPPVALPREATRLATERDQPPPGAVPMPGEGGRGFDHADPTMFVPRRRRRPIEALVHRWPPAKAGLASLRRVETRLKSYGRLPAIAAGALVLLVLVIALARSGESDEEPARVDVRHELAAARAAAQSAKPVTGRPGVARRVAAQTRASEDNAAAAALATGDAEEPEAAKAPASDRADSTGDAARAPAAPAFDAKLAGEQAALAASRCLSQKRRRRVALAVTLRFGRSGRSNKVFFSPTPGMSRAERRCLVSGLRGIDAGGPTSPRLVTYTLRFPGGRPVFHIDRQR